MEQHFYIKKIVPNSSPSSVFTAVTEITFTKFSYRYFGTGSQVDDSTKPLIAHSARQRSIESGGKTPVPLTRKFSYFETNIKL